MGGNSVSKRMNKICSGVRMKEIPVTMQKKICTTCATATNNSMRICKISPGEQAYEVGATEEKLAERMRRTSPNEKAAANCAPQRTEEEELTAVDALVMTLWRL